MIPAVRLSNNPELTVEACPESDRHEEYRIHKENDDAIPPLLEKYAR